MRTVAPSPSRGGNPRPERERAVAHAHAETPPAPLAPPILPPAGAVLGTADTAPPPAPDPEVLGMSARGTTAPAGAAAAAGKAPLAGAYAAGSLPFTGTDVLLVLSLGTLMVLTGLGAHRLLARRGG